MIGSIRQFEILNSIVASVFVDVVNDLARVQDSPDVFFHHKPMLKHEVSVSVRMTGSVLHNVPILADTSPALPSRVVTSASVAEICHRFDSKQNDSPAIAMTVSQNGKESRRGVVF